MMTLANKITIVRIALIPVFIVTLLQGIHPVPAIIFSLTIVTDALDGFVARWKKQKTQLGSFLDPLADKLLMLSSFITLVYLKIIPLWIFVVILSRDLIILLGWMLIYFMTSSKEITPRFLGKLTTIIQMLTILFLLFKLPPHLMQTLTTSMVIMTAISCVDYLIAGSKKLGKQN